MFTLYLAQSLDGFIAGPNDETPWSEKEWELFKNEVSKHNALIIGRKTFEIMIKGNEFSYIEVPYIFVLSNTAESVEKLSTKLDPRFHAQAFNEVSHLPQNLNYIIAGGAKTAEYFLERKLIDQLVLDIEFLFLGNGIKVDWRKLKGLELKHEKTIDYASYGVQMRFRVNN